jgi:hypothetical protein
LIAQSRAKARRSEAGGPRPGLHHGPRRQRQRFTRGGTGGRTTRVHRRVQASGLVNARSGRRKANGSLLPSLPPSSRAVSVMTTSAPAHGWSVTSLMVCATPLLVRACGGGPRRHDAAARRARRHDPQAAGIARPHLPPGSRTSAAAAEMDCCPGQRPKRCKRRGSDRNLDDAARVIGLAVTREGLRPGLWGWIR